jgi:hypothetical protein
MNEERMLEEEGGLECEEEVGEEDVEEEEVEEGEAGEEESREEEMEEGEDYVREEKQETESELMEEKEEGPEEEIMGAWEAVRGENDDQRKIGMGNRGVTTPWLEVQGASQKEMN